MWQKCPVCEGRGEMQASFYDGAQADIGAVQKCKSCEGKGILFAPEGGGSPVYLSYPVYYPNPPYYRYCEWPPYPQTWCNTAVTGADTCCVIHAESNEGPLYMGMGLEHISE